MNVILDQNFCRFQTCSLKFVLRGDERVLIYIIGKCSMQIGLIIMNTEHNDNHFVQKQIGYSLGRFYNCVGIRRIQSEISFPSDGPGSKQAQKLRDKWCLRFFFYYFEALIVSEHLFTWMQHFQAFFVAFNR